MGRFAAVFPSTSWKSRNSRLKAGKKVPQFCMFQCDHRDQEDKVTPLFVDLSNFLAIFLHQNQDPKELQPSLRNLQLLLIMTDFSNTTTTKGNLNWNPGRRKTTKLLFYHNHEFCGKHHPLERARLKPVKFRYLNLSSSTKPSA